MEASANPVINVRLGRGFSFFCIIGQDLNVENPKWSTGYVSAVSFFNGERLPMDSTYRRIRLDFFG